MVECRCFPAISINKVRQEEKNVLFVISGDMVQGSLIDKEYRGLSTIEIMNYLAPVCAVSFLARWHCLVGNRVQYQSSRLTICKFLSSTQML